MKYWIFDNKTNQLASSIPWSSFDAIAANRYWSERIDNIYVAALEESPVVTNKPGVKFKCIPIETDGAIVTNCTIQIDASELNLTTNRETYNRIKAWCEAQPEGCEEAFINMGIEDKNSSRYLAYIEAKRRIKASQSAKKYTIPTTSGEVSVSGEVD